MSVDKIARASGLSLNRLNDMFKKEMEMTIGRYLTQKRVSNARRLLEEGTGIPEAAAMSGYSSPSYFSHVFHKHYGISPQEYIRSSRAEKTSLSLQNADPG